MKTDDAYPSAVEFWKSFSKLRSNELMMRLSLS
jgi:hypothetical protein